MKIGIGLPTTIPGARRDEILEWARRAESAGFSSLGTIDRIVYSNHEPLVALAAASAVTERIGLITSILILPSRGSAAVVAKQAATLHALSGGRLVLGAAVGGRPDDYEAAGVRFEDRGKRFDRMLDEMKRLWSGESRGFAGAVGPDVSDDPPALILGGQADAGFLRAARFGDGWMMGTAPPEYFPPALDPDPDAELRKTVGSYYAFAGEVAEMMVAGAAKGEEEVRERVRAFEEVGCEELIMCPASSDPGQVEKLAAAVL
jgi:alkanesulfonate monooxygenase SsuD/methylene tetrahydromethanopterin reductase-like flavin-dependent oxidoreductase (luciferase family)